MSHKPELSVIIPTYHRNDLLAKCLELLAPGVQTLSIDNYEVIVTDDGSQITAEAMIQEQYPWVKWVAGPRKGPAANRNNGAKYAQGKWLVFTDDDCLPTAHWLQAFAEAITFDIEVYEGKTICKIGIHSPLEHAPVNISGGCLWSCNIMILQKKFTFLNGFDENYPFPHMEDIDFRERIKLSKTDFRFVETALVDHPPRKLPWGKHLGETHESLVYFWYKYQDPNISTERLVKIIIITRIKAILKNLASLDSIKALFSLAPELTHVALNIKKWKNKYSI